MSLGISIYAFACVCVCMYVCLYINHELDLTISLCIASNVVYITNCDIYIVTPTEDAPSKIDISIVSLATGNI